jgi:hypothetical protein
VARDAFIEAQFVEDAEHEREAVLEVFASFVLVLESGQGRGFCICALANLPESLSSLGAVLAS